MSTESQHESGTPASFGKASVRNDFGANLIRWPLYVIGVFVLIMVVAQSTSHLFDHALANLLTTGLTFLGYFVLWPLALRRTGYARFAILAGILVIAGIVGMFNFDGFNAEMVPTFSARWATRAEPPDVTGDSTDNTFAARETDFPQFLGRNRNAITSIGLDANWQATPPELTWKQSIGAGWSGFAVQGDAAITLEQREEEEWITAYSMIDGSLLWKYAVPGKHSDVAGGTGPRSTPTLHQDRVYATLAVSEFVCLDITTGEKLWSHSLLDLADTTQEAFEKEVSWGRAGSPLIWQDLVIVPFGGVGDTAQPLIAFDVTTGEEKWRGGEGQISYSSPLVSKVAGIEQLLFVSQDKVAGYLPASGKQLWELEWPGRANGDPSVSPPVPFGDDQLLIGKGYGVGSRLLQVRQEADQWQVEVLWKSTAMKTKFTTAVIKDGFAYGLSDGILECIDVATGKRKWKKGRYRHGQLLLVDDHLVISAESGELVLVKASPERWEELYRAPFITDVSWNTLTISGDRLLMRNADTVACVQLPVVPDQPSAQSKTDSSTPET